MPIWKGKKKEHKFQEKLCPNCLKPTIIMTSEGAGLIAHEQYYCKSCGYIGKVYVDVGGKSEHEDELELELLLSEEPDFVKKIRPVAELAAEALAEKWTPIQASNHHTLRDWCPFCAEVQTLCVICPCPKEICSNHATEGLIGELNTLYDNETELCNVDAGKYQQIVQTFQKLVQKSK